MLERSAQGYSYDSAEELDFELNLRREIVNCAGILARSGLQFETFRNSYCNGQYWIRTSDGGFDLRRGMPASLGIRDMYRSGGKYGTECATAMQIVYYGALLNVVGEQAFNKRFRDISLMNWRRISEALRETGYMSREYDYLPGDRRYFANPDVRLETPEWQGENVIDLGDGTYYGHGVGILRGADIIDDLNGNRRPGAQRSAYLMNNAGRPSFKKLYGMFA
jgi:protein-glutamine gamma-glutamyltransferase